MPLSADLSTKGKPWSSGRVLTPAQREAKRYRDRISKRAKVQKQKDNLKDLQSQIMGLQNMLHSHIGTFPLLPSGEVPQDHSYGPYLSPLPEPPLYLHDTISIEEQHSPPQDDPSDASDTSFESKTEICVRAPVPHRAIVSSPTLILPPTLQEDGSCTILDFTNGILATTRKIEKIEICTNNQLNQDAIIRGVLEGWHTLQGRTYSCPLWKTVRRIDELVFMHSGILTRLAMLSTIHMMLLAIMEAENFKKLPPWYRPRPTQINFPHQATADYFAWPGLRERLVISKCDILTNRFFRYFAASFRLFWPYPISSAYEMDSTVGLYSFSDDFGRHAGDIEMWTMCKDFFATFPDLQEDMKAEIPFSLSFSMNDPMSFSAF